MMLRGEGFSLAVWRLIGVIVLVAGCSGSGGESFGAQGLDVDKVQVVGLADEQGGSAVCSGLVVGDGVVVTAAHCVSSGEELLWLGSDRLNVWPSGLFGRGSSLPVGDVVVVTVGTDRWDAPSLVSPRDSPGFVVETVDGSELLDVVDCAAGTTESVLCFELGSGLETPVSGLPVFRGNVFVGVVSSWVDGVLFVSPIDVVWGSYGPKS